jgi:hypothetical protein
VLPEEIDLKRHYWITCHRDLKQAPRVRAVIDFLREAVRGEDARFVPPYVTAAGPARRTRTDI